MDVAGLFCLRVFGGLSLLLVFFVENVICSGHLLLSVGKGFVCHVRVPREAVFDFSTYLSDVQSLTLSFV